MISRTQLAFSAPRLLGIGMLCIAFGVAGAGLAWELGDKELMRYASILRLLGPDGARA